MPFILKGLKFNKISNYFKRFNIKYLSNASLNKLLTNYLGIIA